MSLIWRRRDADLSALLPPPPGGVTSLGTQVVTPATSLRVSATWACLRLRADLISTLPVDVFRRVEGRAVEVPKPPVLTRPSAVLLWNEWLWASQFDLDRFGNAFGQIVAWDGNQRPAQIELSDAQEWSVSQDRTTGKITYRRRGIIVDSTSVWHERQYVVPGLPVGLSPIAYAAWTTGYYLSAQEFALAWFTSGATVPGVLRNTARTLPEAEAGTMKSRFRRSQSERSVFVAGKDWEYLPGVAAASDARFIDAMNLAPVEIARFIGAPADLVDAAIQGQNITYANITQRHLQLLVINLGPAITRRELRFSESLVASPRFVKFNSDALLRMDAETKLTMLAAGVAAGIYTEDEARAWLDMPPLTDEQIEKMKKIKGKSDKPPALTTGVPA